MAISFVGRVSRPVFVSVMSPLSWRRFWRTDLRVAFDGVTNGVLKSVSLRACSGLYQRDSFGIGPESRSVPLAQTGPGARRGAPSERSCSDARGDEAMTLCFESKQTVTSAP